MPQNNHTANSPFAPVTPIRVTVDFLYSPLFPPYYSVGGSRFRACLVYKKNNIKDVLREMTNPTKGTLPSQFFCSRYRRNGTSLFFGTKMDLT